MSQLARIWQHKRHFPGSSDYMAASISFANNEHGPASAGRVLAAKSKVMADDKAHIEHHTLQMANILQSTLDIGKLIELFANELAELVPLM